MIKCVSETCDYFASYGECSSVCEKQGVKKNITNADRIRGMTDKELVGLLHQAYTDGVCDLIRSMRDADAHVNTISDYQNWLRQPAKEEP